MSLESGNYISDLVASNPPGTDPVSQGDDHLRLIKDVLKKTFPNIDGAVTATQGQINAADRGPAFRLTSGGEPITPSAFTKCTIQNEIFDTDNACSNSRFAPQVAGYYLICGAVYITGTPVTYVGAQIRLNDTVATSGVSVGSRDDLIVNASSVVFLNGTTDYVELWAYADGTGLAIGAGFTQLSGALVRAA